MTDEFTTAAKNEAARSYSSDWDPAGEVPLDDWGLSRMERDAFRAGAEWARDHLAAQEPIDAVLMTSREETISDRLSDAGYTEYAEDEDGGVTWVSAPLGEVLRIVNAAQEPTGAERAVSERDETIKEQRAKIEDLRKAVWEHSEIIGDLREDLATAEARVPSTPKEALTLAWELACPVQEGQMIPAGTPYIRRFDSGVLTVVPEGVEFDKSPVLNSSERRTLTPLPVSRPRHAEVIERELDVCIGGDGNEDLADKIARAIEEQEADDE